jgi:uncharacterized protein YkwD
MKLLIVLLSFLPFLGLTQSPELKEAVDYLNAMRANPAAFSKDVGLSLSGISPRKPLKWNATLAQVAQTKAEDMARNNYFSHVDKKGYGMNYYINKAGYRLPDYWLKDKKNNFCESIAAGPDTPVDGIVQLINDGGVKQHDKAGHRVHLLGISDFYKDNVDIGIGWASSPNSTYKTYMVVIITHPAE